MEGLLATDRCLAALASLIADHEAEYGPITDDELAVQNALDREAALPFTATIG